MFIVPYMVQFEYFVHPLTQEEVENVNKLLSNKSNKVYSRTLNDERDETILASIILVLNNKRVNIVLPSDVFESFTSRFFEICELMKVERQYKNMINFIFYHEMIKEDVYETGYDSIIFYDCLTKHLNTEQQKSGGIEMKKFSNQDFLEMYNNTFDKPLTDYQEDLFYKFIRKQSSVTVDTKPRTISEFNHVDEKVIPAILAAIYLSEYEDKRVMYKVKKCQKNIEDLFQYFYSQLNIHKKHREDFTTNCWIRDGYNRDTEGNWNVVFFDEIGCLNEKTRNISVNIPNTEKCIHTFMNEYTKECTKDITPDEFLDMYEKVHLDPFTEKHTLKFTKEQRQIFKMLIGEENSLILSSRQTGKTLLSILAGFYLSMYKGKKVVIGVHTQQRNHVSKMFDRIYLELMKTYVFDVEDELGYDNFFIGVYDENGTYVDDVRGKKIDVVIYDDCSGTAEFKDNTNHIFHEICSISPKMNQKSGFLKRFVESENSFFHCVFDCSYQKCRVPCISKNFSKTEFMMEYMNIPMDIIGEESLWK